MRAPIRTSRLVTLALAAAGTAIACGARAAEPLTEVIVEAPKVVHTSQKVPPLGAGVDIASVRYRVSYADLDISTPAGAKTLEQRIDDAAKKACAQLLAAAPIGSTPVASDPPCEKTAVAGAMKQANAAIAAATKARK
ncbi:MAG TPA: UrcA family protein [Steroidobacteraceae bacterium]|nr:UrcA family protein [Steroidobacteraceae bacterium]